MATDLKSSTQGVSLCRFWGGKEQKMQVTMRREDPELTAADKFFNSIHLTRDEAKTLALDLLRFSEAQELEEI